MRHVKSGQHATVALHPCHLPLQPSQATQQFSQPHQTSPVTISNSPGFVLNGSSTVDQQASLQELVHQQQEMRLHWQQQQPVPQQLQGMDAGSVEAAASLAAGSACSATSAAASGSASREQQGGAVAPQALPAGLMSQALARQSQTAQQAPFPQQQDPYVLDDRIHREAEEGRHGQQQEAATAVGHYGHSLSSAAPVTVPSMSRNSTTQSDRSPVPVSESPSFAGAVSSSPALTDPAPPNARKGMVLLDASMHSRTVWEFQAVIVLLNGHWPPRGLLSGCWPPKPNTPDTVLSTSLPDSPLGESACTCVGLGHAFATSHT